MNIPFFSRKERQSAVPVLRELDVNRICENDAVVADRTLQDLVASYRQVEFGSANMGGTPHADANRLRSISGSIIDTLQTQFGIALAEGETVADFIAVFPEVTIQ